MRGLDDQRVDILIVDDDVDLLTSLAELMTDCGYSVKAFPDADSALEFALDRRFSVGLFDYRLGSLKTGLDVVENMQQMGCNASYVMITAEVEQAVKMRAVHLKLFDFMRKPVEPQKLIEIVERAMIQAKLAAA
jgi:two-component system, NtrC family, response regulator HydG